MRVIQQFRLLIVLTLLAFLAACSTTTDPSEAYKNETPEQIFTRGEQALKDRNYHQAIKRYEALEVQYPFWRSTELAQLHLIYAYYMTSEYPLTEAAATRFIHMYPTDPHVDYAYYVRGLANFYQNMGVFERIFTIDLATRDLDQIKKSFDDFQTIVRDYPHSVYAPYAYQYMIYLRNMLANHQLEVAEFYYNHGAYIAAANRASLVVRHYQGAPAVPTALLVMRECYTKLNLTTNANEVQRVIDYNHYPTTLPQLQK